LTIFSIFSKKTWQIFDKVFEKRTLAVSGGEMKNNHSLHSIYKMK
jgi:hypothetical protein